MDIHYVKSLMTVVFVFVLILLFLSVTKLSLKDDKDSNQSIDQANLGTNLLMLCFLCPSLNLNAGIHCFAFKRQRPRTVWLIWSYQVFFFNMDIKFVEKLLAWCLESTLPSIISLDHSGFIHDRLCFNLRQVFNVIHSAWSFDFFRHWEWFDWVKCLFF